MIKKLASFLVCLVMASSAEAVGYYCEVDCTLYYYEAVSTYRFNEPGFDDFAYACRHQHKGNVIKPERWAWKNLPKEVRYVCSKQRTDVDRIWALGDGLVEARQTLKWKCQVWHDSVATEEYIGHLSKNMTKLDCKPR